MAHWLANTVLDITQNSWVKERIISLLDLSKLKVMGIMKHQTSYWGKDLKMMCSTVFDTRMYTRTLKAHQWLKFKRPKNRIEF